MKTLKNLFILSFIFLALSSCNTNDDQFYNIQYTAIPNLVQIETKPSYAVNDYIYVNATLNRLQNEAGQTTLLDLRKSTGNANSFNFTYLLEKRINASDWQIVSSTPTNTITTTGRFFSGDFYGAFADFDTVADAYKFRTGLKLESAGEYRISFGYNSSSTNSVELLSESQGTNLFLSINSLLNNLNGSGFYVFTVN
ncbi:MAG: hypothetical protein H7239_10595 [Flavobacterium sp.]|nr:hypothetical protein [Flavobacterium sp.]